MSKRAKEISWTKPGLLILITAVSVFFLTRAYYGRTESKIQTFQIENPTLSPTAGDSSDAAVYAYRGDRYFESGAFAQAIIEYRQALKLNPSDADTLNDLGLALHYTGQSQEAVKHVRNATKLKPSYQSAWLSLGFILRGMKNKEEAAIAFEKTRELNPNSPQGQEATRMLSTLFEPKKAGGKK
jgi:tetratricopeptide (TPR) repeat protein